MILPAINSSGMAIRKSCIVKKQDPADMERTQKSPTPKNVRTADANMRSPPPKRRIETIYLPPLNFMYATMKNSRGTPAMMNSMMFWNVRYLAT